jgi:type IV pilus assembly protein PilV
MKNQQGFSLIELLVAISLFAIGVLSVISMQVTGIKSNSIANKLSAATGLAQETMDDIMSWSISDPKLNSNNTNSTYDLNGPDNANDNVVIPGAGTFRATYSTAINTPVTGVTQITVNIFRVIGGTSEENPYITLTSCKRTT